jgi:hypothetical protein
VAGKNIAKVTYIIKKKNVKYKKNKEDNKMREPMRELRGSTRQLIFIEENP